MRSPTHRSLRFSAACIAAFAALCTRIAPAQPAASAPSINALTGWVISVDGGPSYPKTAGDMRGLFRYSPVNEECLASEFQSWPESRGFQVSVRVMHTVSHGVAIGVAGQYSRIDATYRTSSGAVPILDTTGAVQYFERTWTAVLNIDEIRLQPFVRYQPWVVPMFLETGVSLASMFTQHGSTEERLPDGFFFLDSANGTPRQTIGSSTTHLGTPRIQFAALLGVGGELDLGAGVGLEFTVRSRFALNSLFKESTARFEYAIEPGVGLSIAL